jgi:hypothetical protein
MFVVADRVSKQIQVFSKRSRFAGQYPLIRSGPDRLTLHPQCPGEELFSIGRFMHSTGFSVLWPEADFRCGMAQTVVCLRSPAQCPFLPFLTAYQAGSCCQ